MWSQDTGTLGYFSVASEEAAAVAQASSRPEVRSDGRPARPTTLNLRAGAVPDALTGREQWVAWRNEWDADRGEWTKVPVDADTGRYAKSTDHETWTAFADVVAYHHREDTDTDGVGFVVHDVDMFVGVDLDDCRDPATGRIGQWAVEILEAVASYAEVSPSGTGIRIFVLAVLPDGGNRGDVKGTDGHLEMYETGRYLTVTGHAIDEAPAGVKQVNDGITSVHAEHIASGDDGDGVGEQPTTKPATDAEPTGESDAPGGNGLPDGEVLELARSAKNGEAFRRLWDGDTSGHPSPSEATAALLMYLAFWTAGDPEQMDRLFRRSGLMRPKWDDPRGGATWGRYMVRDTIEKCRNFYVPVPDDLDDELADDSDMAASGGRNEMSGPTIKGAWRAVKANGGAASTSEVVDSPLFDRQKSQARVSLNWLEDRGFVEWKREGRRSTWTITGPVS